MDSADVIAVGKEKDLIEIKLLYENKMNTQTKMIKCFGKDNYNKDCDMMKRKSVRMMNDHKC